MSYQLTIIWFAWCSGALLLTLGLVGLNARRRRRLPPSGKELLLTPPPTWRDDVLWGVLVVGFGTLGTGVNLFLLKDGHTARVLLSSVIFGMVMLLGVLMLLKNGLAPNDGVRLDGVSEAPRTPLLEAPDAESLDQLKF